MGKEKNQTTDDDIGLNLVSPDCQDFAPDSDSDSVFGWMSANTEAMQVDTESVLAGGIEAIQERIRQNEEKVALLAGFIKTLEIKLAAVLRITEISQQIEARQQGLPA